MALEHKSREREARGPASRKTDREADGGARAGEPEDGGREEEGGAGGGEEERGTRAGEEERGASGRRRIAARRSWAQNGPFGAVCSLVSTRIGP